MNPHNFIVRGIISMFALNTNVENSSHIFVVDSKFLIPILTFLKFSSCMRFNYLVDIFCVDNLIVKDRFEINYVLMSTLYNHRLIIKVFAPIYGSVPSITRLFKGANWLEREVWDLYGVFFSNHPDLRRILTDYGFDGHPLRKDFPLSGYSEVRYDDDQKRVLLESLSLQQEFRYFDFTSPWERR